MTDRINIRQLGLLPMIVRLLFNAGHVGLKRSVLAKQAVVDAAVLTACMTYLSERNYVTIEFVDGEGFLKPPYTIYKIGPVPVPDDLPKGLPDNYLPDVESGEGLGLPNKPRQQTNIGARCRWCNKMLVAQQSGRPRVYCDLDCRQAYIKTTSTQIGVMFNETEPRHRHLVAYHIVIADLVRRGEVWTPDAGPVQGRVELRTPDGPRIVEIFVAQSDNPDDQYSGPVGPGAIRAVVKLDGRIEYTPSFDKPEPEPEKRAGGADDESTPP